MQDRAPMPSIGETQEIHVNMLWAAAWIMNEMK